MRIQTELIHTYISLKEAVRYGSKAWVSYARGGRSSTGYIYYTTAGMHKIGQPRMKKIKGEYRV
jgi:hypothetical protein